MDAPTQKLFERFRTHPAIAQRITDVESGIANSPVASPRPFEVDYGALVKVVRAHEDATRPWK